MYRYAITNSQHNYNEMLILYLTLFSLLIQDRELGSSDWEQSVTQTTLMYILAGNRKATILQQCFTLSNTTTGAIELMPNP